MRRYYLDLVIRPNTNNGIAGCYVAEQEVRHSIKASNHVEACRSALERAWKNDCLVSRFLSVHYKDLVE